MATSKSQRFAGVGDDAVRKATGKSWAQWFKALNAAGAKKLAHHDIAVMLHAKFNVKPWWSKMVTVGYEQAHGLRVVHQKADGFSASVSRTIPVAVKWLYGAWEDSDARRRWLGGPDMTIRKATTNKSIRITWGSGDSSVAVMFYARGKNKSQVTIEHSRLKTEKDVARMKEFWSAALDRLAGLLTAGARRSAA